MLKYFHGIRIRGNHIHVTYTGIDIHLTHGLFKSAWRAATFNLFLLGQSLIRLLTFRRPKHTLVFHPQPSGPWYNAWLVARMGHVKIVSEKDRADRVFIFDDRTHSYAGDTLSPEQRALSFNADITDISKNHVGDVFEQVFGYSLRIDPLTYEGRAVEKSDANGTHDGRIVTCPLAPEDMRPDCAYQKLVETENADGETEDLRIAWIFGEIPVVYHKYKDPDKHFSTTYLRVDLEDAAEAFSEDERAKIAEFCKTMGLDFGALDAMRDKGDGRIYIVDVNKTCMPVFALPLRRQIVAMRRMAGSFVKGFEG